MGNVYFQKKEYEEAEVHYKKAIKKDPENADAYNNLAWLYYTKRERLDEAEKLALKAIELNPSKKEELWRYIRKDQRFTIVRKDIICYYIHSDFCLDLETVCIP